MARNKRKVVKDKEKFKKIRKEARKRWRNKKANEKAMKNAQKELVPGKPTSKKISSPVAQLPEKTAPKLAAKSKTQVEHRHVREIDPCLIVRSEKFLGCGSFGNCYLAHYRDILVAVKEFKAEKFGRDNMKKEVRNEAKMISHLEDHRGVPLLFGIVTKSEPLRLITKFHGRKDMCVTLSNLIKKKKLDKPTWLGILKDTIKALDHIHSGGILHNDLKSNNVVMEQREQEWNPVVIDFGKARFFNDPKPVMSLPKVKQEEYRKRYPHIAPEIVNGSGRQSYASDIYSLSKIVLAVLNLLPTATARSLRVAKRALCEEPFERPSLKDMLAAL